MNVRKLAIITVLAALMLSTLVLIQPALACPQTNQTNPQDVSVQQAYDMIKHQSERDPVIILDVRNQSEYNMGHLYNAVLIPLYELDSNISALTSYVNDKILIYCAAGSRSAPASQILVAHGFTEVYNMLGGITAWMQADYPIYTSYHYVTVDSAGKKPLLQIDPLLLFETGCIPCAQNQASSSVPANVTSTMLEEDENHTLILLTYEADGTSGEFIIANTLLRSYSDLTNGINKTMKLVSTEITTQDSSIQFYRLSYYVQRMEYNLTLYTFLTPLNSEIYNASFTIMDYTPASNIGVTSLEFVKFNSSVTLSQLYANIGEISEKMAQTYKKSGDTTLTQLAKSYNNMENEARYLSKLVKIELPEYNKVILKSSAILMDDFWSCLACDIAIQALCYLGCLGVCAVFTPFCLFVWACVSAGCSVAVHLTCAYIKACP
jgi:rhodanese-related sulfurtransferase